MQHTDAEEMARARLAYVSAGRPSLGAPRRGLPEPPVPEPPLLSPPLPAEPTSPASAGPKPVATTSRVPTLTVKHLVVVAVLLLCGVGVAVAALGRSAATEVPLEAVTVSAAPVEPSSPAPVKMLRIHVAGAVAEPGVVELPEGTIVEDAILAAGGLAADADPAELNLAAQVADGMQIVIGTVGQPKGDLVGAEPSPGGVSGDAGAGGMVDLNAATAGELESLPGVGPVTAGAIIGWRDEHGPFAAVEELQEISGIGPKTFQKLEPLVTVGS
ncbi:helix-hairpin-helix domain-containing protein [Tessaracoccus sp. MC1756]|uniref:ComEA family DNA-binding protein n=1 Tax=Tessaracoccus sp. MC1756 TaxID=2760311 RepID=UPI0021028405|nr:helix-hairpin-helix domain-containing protein [Tessaracoccus sp. MC1756]